MAEPIVETTPEWLIDVTEAKSLYGVTWLELILRARKQILECESADDETNEISEWDIARLEADLEELNAHEEWGLKRPTRDWPHSKNRMYKVRFVGIEASPNVTNRFCREIGRLFEIAFQEASEGDTMNKRGGLVEHDVRRVQATWDEIRDVIAIAKSHSPKDQPAVTPDGPKAGPGSSNSRPEYSETYGS